VADKERSIYIQFTLLVQSQEGKEGQFHNDYYTILSSRTVITALYTEIGNTG